MLKVRNGRKAVILSATIAAGVGLFAAMMATGTPNVSATPGRTGSCDTCHSYPASSLNVTSDATSRTVTPGTVFAVSISWSGGGTVGAINEINWPTTALDNSRFNPTPRIPYSGTASSGTTYSTLTAPITPGAYTVRVFGATGSPFETDYQDIGITVYSPPPTDTTGPLTSSLNITPNPTVGAISVTLTASVSDTTSGNSNITTAEYFINTPGANGSGVAMTASDGSYNSASEGVRAAVSVSSLTSGNHTLYVHGRDAAGNWGANASTSFTVSAPPDTTGPLTTSITVTPNPTGTATSVTLTASVSDSTTGGSNVNSAEYFIDSPGTNGSGTVMTATDGSFNSATENVRATINISGLAAGSHTIYLHGRDAAGNWGANASVVFTISTPPDTAGPLTTSVTVTPNPTGTATLVTLTAFISDSTNGNSNITTAEYFIDTPGTYGSGIAMTASDGSFNSASEGVRATVSVYGLTVGNHTLYVHGRDAAGNWGANASMSFTVSALVDVTGPVTSGATVSPNPTGTVTSVTLTATISDATTGESDIDSAEYFVDTLGANGTGTAMTASDGSFNAPTEGVRATINVSGLTSGNHIIYVRGHDAAGNWGIASSVTLVVQKVPVVKPPRDSEDEEDDGSDNEDADSDDSDEDDSDNSEDEDGDDSDGEDRGDIDSRQEDDEDNDSGQEDNDSGQEDDEDGNSDRDDNENNDSDDDED